MEEKVQAKQIGPKHNLLEKGSNEAGWTKIYEAYAYVVFLYLSIFTL